jgi:hypothetical protein
VVHPAAGIAEFRPQAIDRYVDCQALPNPDASRRFGSGRWNGRRRAVQRPEELKKNDRV